MAYKVTADDQELLVVAMATDLDFNDTHTFIRTSDFDLPHCRFVFDIVHRFKGLHGILPEAQTIAVEAQMAASGTSKYTYSTVPDQSCAEQLANLIGRIASGVPKSEIVRIGGLVEDYLSEVRGRQTSRIAAEQGMSSGEYMDLMVSVRQDIKSSSGGSFDFSDACDFEESELETPKFRLPTGVEVLDNATNGGLAIGEVACLVAPSGLGKTTGMINFGAHATTMGYHTLFITLENDKTIIRARWQAILGHYPMSRYNTPLSSWPEQDKARFKALISKDCPLRGRMTILDGSQTTFTTANIDAAIHQWKMKLAKNGLEDKGVAVYVDWLKQIDPTGTPGVTDKSRSDEPITMIVRELGKLAKKHKVVIWTAQQLNRGGQNKEMAGPADIADATGIQNFLDLGISFGRPAADAAALQQQLDGSSKGVNPDTDRTMILGSFKSRNSDIVGRKMTVYQSPSLKLWKSKEEYIRATARIKRADPRDLYFGGRP